MPSILNSLRSMFTTPARQTNPPVVQTPLTPATEEAAAAAPDENLSEAGDAGHASGPSVITGPLDLNRAYVQPGGQAAIPNFDVTPVSAEVVSAQIAKLASLPTDMLSEACAGFVKLIDKQGDPETKLALLKQVMHGLETLEFDDNGKAKPNVRAEILFACPEYLQPAFRNLPQDIQAREDVLRETLERYALRAHITSKLGITC